MARRERDTDLPGRMSEHEALMWAIEKDPWLNPSGASIVLLDQPLDMDRFMQSMRAGIAKTPRLYQRVVPGFARLATPAWVPDAEFDISAHVREMVLPAPGTMRQLLDLAAQLYAEPLDRTRPLWRFVVIHGVEDDRSAMYTLIHHSVSDGIGQLRMAELYQQLTRDEPAPPDVDLDAVIAAAVEAATGTQSGGDLSNGTVTAVRDGLAHQTRRQWGIGRRLAGEVALWPADPRRISIAATNVADTVRDVLKQLAPSDGEASSGSELWSARSRHRHLEWIRLPVDELKVIGAAGGGTLNDAFMAVLAEAAYRYHVARSAHIDTVKTSFVLSTRTDKKAGGNAFTPVPVKLPAGPMAPTERLGAVVEAVEQAKERAQKTGGMMGLSGVVNLLPTSMITQAARSAASRIDFATSNLRGAPFEVFVSGAKVLATVPMGPVAGTGANITALSLEGSLHIGVFSDPAAITEPEAFAADIRAAYDDLLAAATGGRNTTPVKRATKKQATRKRAAKKRTATKRATKKQATKKQATKKQATKKQATRKRAATKRTAKQAASVDQSELAKA